MEDLNAKNTINSPLWRHCITDHSGEMQHFQMTISGSYKNDPMLRQITEAVQINRMDENNRMNDRAEWNMTSIPRTTINTT